MAVESFMGGNLEKNKKSCMTLKRKNKAECFNKVMFATILWLFLGSVSGRANESLANTNRDSSDLVPGQIEKALEILPTNRQLTWQKRELQALIHFGPNTFTGREWGSGVESPSIFNPTNLNCSQWVETAQSFGAKSITFTAKHHDGFCLWPSKYTKHSVKYSPWKNGQGDVVQELANACRKVGMAFGIYLSPADLNEPNCGRNNAKYNDYFCNQLRELLTDYGEICEVFLDGAQPPGRNQVYDFPRYYQIIRELQPNAVISMRGPDVRWVGNEGGYARESEWSVVAVPVDPENYNWPDMTAPDLGSRSRLSGAPFLHWYPAATDFSLRKKWFWSSEKGQPGQTLKTVGELLQIYTMSVGRNSVFQMNFSPDNRGIIPVDDVKRMKEFGIALQDHFGTNVLVNAGVQMEPMEAQDGGGFAQRVILSKPQKMRYVVLQEDITQGQRVESFEVVISLEDGGKKVYRATTIGWKRIVSVGDVQAKEIEVRFKQFRAPPLVSVLAF